MNRAAGRRAAYSEQLSLSTAVLLKPPEQQLTTRCQLWNVRSASWNATREKTILKNKCREASARSQSQHSCSHHLNGLHASASDAGMGTLDLRNAGSPAVESPIGERLWYVPACRALRISAGKASNLRMRGAVRIRMVYLHDSLCKKMLKTYASHVTRLLHKSNMKAARRSVGQSDEPPSRLIMDRILSPFVCAAHAADAVRYRARRVSKSLMHDPARRETLRDSAHEPGARIRRWNDSLPEKPE